MRKPIDITTSHNRKIQDFFINNHTIQFLVQIISSHCYNTMNCDISLVNSKAAFIATLVICYYQVYSNSYTSLVSNGRPLLNNLLYIKIRPRIKTTAIKCLLIYVSDGSFLLYSIFPDGNKKCHILVQLFCETLIFSQPIWGKIDIQTVSVWTFSVCNQVFNNVRNY